MVKSSEDEVRNNCFSEDRIVDIVNEAAQDSALLLNIIHQHHTQDVDNTLKTFIDRWVLAQEKFQILSPTALVAEWVRIQCQKNGTAYPAPTIYSLVPSLGNSEQGSCIIIVEELLNYRKMQNIDPQFLEQMENHILDIIGTISSKHINDRFNFLIDCGKRLASRGLKGQFDCIAYITEAVNLLVSVMFFFFFFFLTIFLCSHWQRKCDKGDIKVKIGDELRRLLPNAFFLLSLIKRLACPMQKDYTEDIKSGLKLYLENPPSKLNEAECTLLFCILDLLSLEANVELQCEVYEIMIKSSGRNLKEFLGIALQSGNLHHTLCSSPVNAAFLDMVQKHSSLSTDDVKFWRTCVSSESLKAGTYQSLSMLPTLSYLELDDDTRPTKAQETIKEVKLAALSLITSVSESKNEFAAAHHYYNLAEIMIAKGLMTEALTYANEGYRLRNKLLSECFNIEWEGGTEKTSKYLCKTFYMHPSRLSSLGSYCVGTNVYFPTPWNLLRCYLESSLQTGTLHYMIGNSSEASAMLYSGKAISSIQNFPVFLVGFSIALGNMHCKEKDWSSAKRELDSALKSLDDCRRNLCQKCICVLQVKIDQVGGDLDLSIVKNKGENAVNALKIAKDLFVKAKSNLEDKEWENSVSRPERETPKEKNPVLCDFNAACGSNECWHCQTSINETSLSNLTNLKWEIIRRRYLLQVITKLAKCSKLEEDINEERRFLISGIYVLVGRSTFEELELSASFVEEIVRKNVVAEALGAEQASILYKTCCFSLRHENSSGTAILSRNNVLMGLKMAFILSREVPKLHEKVSQILAVVYACSSKDDKLSELERASAIRSASYFHQCSIGSYFNSCFLSQDQNQMEVDGFGDLRLLLAPRSMKELEESMSKFLESLQKLSVTVTVLCISMFSDKSYPILHKFLPERSNSVWLMISRFHLKNGPVVVIFPVIETLTDFPYEKDTSVGQWTCPWAGNLFDQVAPVLRLVLEEDDKLASGQKSSEVVKKRTRHDNFLREFLRNLENSWLGQWKYLLLGECSGCDDLHDNVDIISNDCRSLNSVFEGDQHCWEQLKSNHGCYIGASGGKIDKSVKKNLGDTNEKKCRKPVIIVSHLSTQMIPLESLPILEKEEVYRMPSFGSILRSTSKNRNSLNPCKCYYLIMGDHVDPRTELIKCFKDWSETFQFEGKAGISEEVSAGDLKEALETQDLFIYAGHGDGTQYIPGIEIRKISNCCAAILMGCSSGYLYSRYHAMESATLDYLLAGSPVVVANLWTVYSIDVQSFLKTLFEAWTKATTTKLVECNSNLKKRGSTGMSLCKHGFNLGSAMPKAREACKRRYAEGAASVIYGIPTQIARVIENASQLER